MIRLIRKHAAKYWLASVFLTTLAVSRCAALEKPKVIAFVVGIENYTDPAENHLNGLKSVARDAEDFFEQLRAIADVDLLRSRLLIASNSAKADSRREGHLFHKQAWESEDILSELRQVLGTVKSNDTVIIFFGGHGRQYAHNLHILASNFSYEREKGFINYVTIKSTIEEKLRTANLITVPVIVFANMCHAGAAAASPGGDELNNSKLTEILNQQTRGLPYYAFFPAAERNKLAFEKGPGGRSEFAHAVLEGLRGGAAEDDKIFTGKLFAFVNNQLGGNLPRDPSGFDDDLIIGVTSDQKTFSRYLLGLAHLAFWQNDGDPTHGTLALHHFDSAVNAGGELASLAHWRWFQSIAATNRPESEWIDAARAFTSNEQTIAKLPASDQSLANALFSSHKIRFESLTSFREYLVTGGRFNFLFVSQENRSQDVTSQNNYQVFWSRFFEQFHGLHQKDDLIKFDIKDYFTEIRKKMDEFGSSRNEPLVIVYSGRGFLDNKLNPLDKQTLNGLSSLWNGEVIIIYTSPFQIHDILVLNTRNLPPNIRIFISGTEPGQFTVRSALSELYESRRLSDAELRAFIESKSDYSTNELMAHALLNGPDLLHEWEPLQRYKVRYKQYRRPDQFEPYPRPAFPNEPRMVMGTPAWISGRLSTIDRLSSSITGMLDIGLMAVAGCLHSDLLTCRNSLSDKLRSTNASPSLQTNKSPSIVHLLRGAAEAELKGDIVGARKGYAKVIELLKNLPKKPLVEAGLSEAMRDEMLPLVKKLEDRIVAAQRRLEPDPNLSRELHFIPIVIDEYRSPYVAHLPNAKIDSEVWKQTIEDVINTGQQDVRFVLYPAPAAPATTIELVQYLQKILENVDEDDLVVLMYSGRGVSKNGRFWLAMANANPSPKVQSTTTDDLPWEWSDEHLVSLDKIAQIAGNRRLFAIYDTQFEHPHAQPLRVDILHEKHLDSVRPLTASLPESAHAERLRFEQSTFGLQHQIHIWLEGRVSQKFVKQPTRRCSIMANGETENFDDLTARAQLTSSLSAILLANIERGKTYRQVVKEAANCIEPLGSGGFLGTLVAQGNIDLPVLEGGKGLEDYVRLKDDAGFRELNIGTAISVANLAVQQGAEPDVRLSQAKFKVMLAEHEKQFEGPQRANQATGGLDTSILPWLAELEDSFTTKPELAEAWLDVFSRALELSGKKNEMNARYLLVERLAEQTPRNEALINRVVSLTRRGLRAQVGPLLNDLDRVIRASESKDQLIGLSDAIREAKEFVTSERKSTSEPFRIDPQFAQ